MKYIMNYENKFLPEIGYEQIDTNDNTESIEIIGDSKCPCCGYLTIPNKGDANAYICPVCMWEIDLFIKSDDEASDLNNGLSLKEAIKNYQEFGAVLQRLKEYCREPMELVIKEYSYSEKRKLSQMFYQIQSEEFSWVDKSTLSLHSFEKSTDGEIIYVAFINGEIAGFISVWKDDSFIHNLFVAKQYRSLGVGKRLLEKVITVFNKPLTLKCVKKNLNAVQFYLHNGWKIENEQISSDGAYYLMSFNS